MDSKRCLTSAGHPGTGPTKGAERFLLSTISLRSDDKKDYPTFYHATSLQVKDSRRRYEIQKIKGQICEIQNKRQTLPKKMDVCYTWVSFSFKVHSITKLHPQP